MRWRVADPSAPAPPEPWPERVDAFMVACAMEAARLERTMADVVEGMAAATQKAGR